MRVISMVPSWTETLLEAGVDVVGRTKFCIHPADRVGPIPIVGGTKKLNWEKVAAQKADLLLLDREENPRWMADEAPIPWYASHVRRIGDLPDELGRIAARLDHPPRLLSFAERWQRISAGSSTAAAADRPLSQLPGVLQWFDRPGPSCSQFVYLIWHDPWMAVAPATFIGSVFARLGFGSAHAAFDRGATAVAGQGAMYPVVDLTRLDPQRTLLLFSSEPFPFAARPQLMRDCGFAAALVDGEAYSWFGLRALRFVESSLG